MPKSKELISSSGSESGSDEEPKPKKKKSEAKPEKKEAKASSGPVKNDNGEYEFELSSNKIAKVREFKGRTYIDIREYYEKDGKQLPGKKGISLTPEQWNRLKDHVDEIDECIKKM